MISAFAGTGTKGSIGDGGLATAAQLNLYFDSALAVDAMGNVYIADGDNYKIRMVTPQGIISTVVGNGTLASPDGVQATAAGFSTAGSMVFDAAGNLYIASRNYSEIYRLSGGVIHRLLGTSTGSLADGTPALSTSFFTESLKIDQNGDIYAVDSFNNTVRKLILNSPNALLLSDGNNQTGQTGQGLAKALKVQVNGRAGTGVPGVVVNFAVTSGSAALSAASTQTDATGVAGVGLTLGSAAGNVVVTATVAGVSLPAVQFTETATVPCTVPQPNISSINSATDFGAYKTFAPGSWVEIHGSNLSQSTRQWANSDFSGSSAPVSLDGVSVAIDGKPAFVGYISPAQINVQAPADTLTGAVQVTVTTSACASAAFTSQEAAFEPGLLAPASFNIGGKQYMVAQFQDLTYVGNVNLISGAPFRPAAPGDTLTAYGIGFGGVTPPVSPGTIAAGTTNIPGLTIAFGTTQAQVLYAGLAPGAVGEYQFVFVTPNVPDGDYPITVQAGSTQVPQTLYLTVHH